jgi:hypothetical protein
MVENAHHRLRNNPATLWAFQRRRLGSMMT